MGKLQKRLLKYLGLAALMMVLGVIGVYVTEEMRTSKYQAHYLSLFDSQLNARVEPGRSSSILYPQDGPYDQRLGYTELPFFQDRLESLGFKTIAQARFSPELLRVVNKGFFTPYVEKVQAGLTLLDRDSKVIFNSLYPSRIYTDFKHIPKVILGSLLFIENRELLNERYPNLNPAVEWDRFARGSLELVAKKLGANINVPGGSTLATQMEKFRHSPGGRTDSAMEKIRQMGSASIRAYLRGPNTLETRRDIALAYINSMPLAAAPKHGEVHGLGDGLWAWFGTELTTVNQLLDNEKLKLESEFTEAQARAFRQVLCLFLAQRRPAYYLLAGRPNLEPLVDGHLRVLAAQGVIPAGLRDAALKVRSGMLADAKLIAANTLSERKIANVLRTRLAGTLGMPRLYSLDRVDLKARATLDYTTQQAVTSALRRLSTKKGATEAEVLGFRLLNDGNNLGKIVYSLVLYERSAAGNLLRVQADNYDQPLDVNEGIRIDLGSTAKLRTTVHYLEVIAEIYQRYVGQSVRSLRKVKLHQRDVLSRWVLEKLKTRPKPTLDSVLMDALARPYSASPREAFYTGQGLHTFANFNAEDNGKTMSVREALQESVNLVFIRLLRDVVYYHLYQPNGVAHWLDNENDSEHRQEYLKRFADQEGQAYLRRFYAKYRDKSPNEVVAALSKGVAPIATRLATVYRSIYPQDDQNALHRYLRTYGAGADVSDKKLKELYESYSIDKFNLHDRGYIARIHPLELWLVSYLVQHPGAKLSEVVAASVTERQEVYRWLFKTRHPKAQEKRIRSLVEQEAFARVHEAWKRVGYPFDTLTPSYATAIGASGDRPAALAELTGIIMNAGTRMPTVRFEDLHFAADTPYETVMQAPSARGRQVLLPAVAAAARSALIDVVEKGTAKRLSGQFKAPDGTPLIVAGKTGTGDHRREIFGARGRRVATEVKSRAAVFTFMLGDRMYGVLTAYVTGRSAARYHFTSALPVQVLKSLVPTLSPMLHRAYAQPENTDSYTLSNEAPPAKL